MTVPAAPGPVEQTPEFRRLIELAGVDRSFDIRSALADDERRSLLTVEACGLRVDLTRQRLDGKILSLLIELAERQGVGERIEATFAGERINTTEDRSVLHTALRLPPGSALEVEGVDVAAEVHEVLDRMSQFAEAIRDGSRTAHDGGRFEAIVNIGIGGSNLGPQMATAALRSFSDPSLEVRFVSNVDPADLTAQLDGLNPKRTLFIVCSKTFTTLETLTNATAAREWLLAGTGGDTAAVASQMVAVSTATDEVRAFGIDPEAGMFGFWDWVGGRYSVDSAVGLSLMLAIGPENFRKFLAGMHEIDEHLRQAEPDRSLPWLIALSWLWNGSLLGHETVAVLPYSQDLRLLPAYLQQLVMESNGKRVRLDGEPVGVETAPIVWGAAGTDGQHAFHQLLHQGTRTVPCDLIGFARQPDGSNQARQDMLVANLIAQAEALSVGRTAQEVVAVGGSEELAEHRSFPGGRPVTVILADRLDPETLGKLIALYEHATLIEGAIWGIDSFDQWGVELGKELARNVGPELAGGEPVAEHDRSTVALIDAVKRLRAG
jgi:glucose-6-phosphate isomerase